MYIIENRSACYTDKENKEGSVSTRDMILETVL